MSNYDTGLVKCGYCGNYHSYSAEMCKDMVTRPAPAVVENIKYPTGDTLASLYRYTLAEVRERERAAWMSGHDEGYDLGIHDADHGMVNFPATQKWAEAEALRRYGGEA